MESKEERTRRTRWNPKRSELEEEGGIHKRSKLEEEGGIHKRSELEEEGGIHKRSELEEEGGIHKRSELEEGGIHKKNELEEEGGIHKGSELEEDPELRADDPLKQKGSRRAFHGDSNRCYPMANGDGEAWLITCAPTGVRSDRVQDVLSKPREGNCTLRS